jgi:hypothetical protein
MRIVFDEVLGSVAGPTEQEEKQQKAGAAPVAASPQPPKSLARELRVMAERKARLHAC